jgi:GNAT superfamily N-acetyltransferase
MDLSGKTHFIIRPIEKSDSLEALTMLLHRAYKKWADKGLRYLASYQDVQTTKKRLEKGQCFVALLDNNMVGTITYYSDVKNSRHDWYKQPFVAKYGQLAVDPSLQKSGLGSMLIDHVETLAQQDGFTEITIDTAESATELVNYYIRKSYRPVAYTQWKETNYRSVLLSKTLIQNTIAS